MCSRLESPSVRMPAPWTAALRTAGRLMAAATIPLVRAARQQRLAGLDAEAADIAAEARNLVEQVDHDPAAMALLEERISLIFALERRYGDDEGAILEHGRRMSAEAAARLVCQGRRRDARPVGHARGRSLREPAGHARQRVAGLRWPVVDLARPPGKCVVLLIRGHGLVLALGEPRSRNPRIAASAASVCVAEGSNSSERQRALTWSSDQGPRARISGGSVVVGSGWVDM